MYPCKYACIRLVINYTIQKHPGCKKGEAKSEAPVNAKKLLDQQATKKTDIRCRPRPGLL